MDSASRARTIARASDEEFADLCLDLAIENRCRVRGERDQIAAMIECGALKIEENS